jgi:rare lipoprotein A
MYKIALLVLSFLVLNCSFFQRQPKGNREVDGIIYLDEEEYKKMGKPSKEKSGEITAQAAGESKQLDGILYLTEDAPQATSPSSQAQTQSQPLEPGNIQEKGQASYYANKFKGKKTASGELYDPNKMTAAHRTLAFGTMVRVLNLDNKKIVTVKINDRGPHVKARIIDLSYAAAEKLDIIRSGVGEVAIEVVK